MTTFFGMSLGAFVFWQSMILAGLLGSEVQLCGMTFLGVFGPKLL
ncbi:hypothetical protein Ccrd_002262 [Cynara cardunculus var. scolymus]|uniref:Uncharacterized protein n=1 Tax=Cynara cardunculus var. scolymus TaxID=59895 RepID=A0A103XRP1_CYNCS|nr:hypothetical protein Ccrd_002262 [Cynara cardunculus var. scolymus]